MNSRGRCKSRGWAAMNPEHCRKQPQIDSDDPFPPLQTSSTNSILPSPSSNVPSFSSIVHSFADFPPMAENVDSSPIEIKEGYGGDFSLSELQRLHSWADQSLIEDVMAMVNNDTGKATALLREMVSSNGDISDCYDLECKKGGDDKSLLESTSDLAADVADLSSTLEHFLKFAPQETATANMKLILGHLKSLPVEPEWEENDVYMSHRRDALRMMRVASRHSRAATNAFIRGDHFTAQQQSLKARKEWSDAERLNSKAAKEILSLRNSDSNPWKFDLHGLHAAEAVQALQEHLRKIETQLPASRQIAPSRLNTRNGSTCSLIGSMNMENTIQSTGFRQRPASLQVITGIGNHSRGQASLPAAVRNFLIENRFKFDETRPGVFTVYPKFHHR